MQAMITITNISPVIREDILFSGGNTHLFKAAINRQTQAITNTIMRIVVNMIESFSYLRGNNNSTNKK